MDVKLLRNSTKEVKKLPIIDYSGRKLDICGVCHTKYNVASNKPRILIHCGHTFCSKCIQNYIHNDHIRCPFCKKLINNMSNSKMLPVNYPLMGEIIGNDPVIMLLLEGQSSMSMYSSCSIHPEKQKHYYCTFHETNFCKECKHPLHKQSECQVADLYELDQIYQQNEADKLKNKLIVSLRNKEKGKKKFEEFFV